MALVPKGRIVIPKRMYFRKSSKHPLTFDFMLKKPCLKVQILQYKFLDLKCHPPFRNFSENTSVLVAWPVPKPGQPGHLGHSVWTFYKIVNILFNFAHFTQLIQNSAYYAQFSTFSKVYIFWKFMHILHNFAQLPMFC